MISLRVPMHCRNYRRTFSESLGFWRWATGFKTGWLGWSGFLVVFPLINWLEAVGIWISGLNACLIFMKKQCWNQDDYESILMMEVLLWAFWSNFACFPSKFLMFLLRFKLREFEVWQVKPNLLQAAHPRVLWFLRAIVTQGTTLCFWLMSILAWTKHQTFWDATLLLLLLLLFVCLFVFFLLLLLLLFDCPYARWSTCGIRYSSHEWRSLLRMSHPVKDYLASSYPPWN